MHKLGVVTGLGKEQDVAIRTEGLEASSRDTGSFLGYFSFRWLMLKSHPNPREENALLWGFGLVYFYLVDGTHVCLGALVCVDACERRGQETASGVLPQEFVTCFSEEVLSLA